MDKNSRSFLIVVVLVLALAFLGLLIFYYRNSNPQPITSGTGITADNQAMVGDEAPQKGELEFQEPQTKIEIGTQGVTKGTFEKVENGSIFLRTSSDTLTNYPLTVDEVTVSCTKQDLTTATELDFDQVSKVKVTTPDALATLIPTSEAVVVFAQDVEGVLRVHTVAIDESKCSL